MSLYLKKYIGTYSVKAEFDKFSKDFPRCMNGDLDTSFDDLYIPCKSGSRIIHLDKNILMACYMSVGVGHNRLKELYQSNIGDINKFQIISEKTGKNANYDFDSMYKELIENDIIVSVDDTNEIIIYFKDENMDKISKIMKPSIVSKNRKPFSRKNLPYDSYNIPIEDLAKYKAILVKIDKDNLFILNGINRGYLQSLVSKSCSIEDIRADMRSKCLKPKEYFHSIGVWDKYLEYLKNGLK